MKNLIVILLVCAFTFGIMGCSSVRQGDGTFVSQAISFRFLGLKIPGDDFDTAIKNVPKGARVLNVNAAMVDWSTFPGILRNILGWSETQIGGTN